MNKDDLRMHSYYYSFEKTGVYAIDRILSAVAHAGEYHHTEFWNDATRTPDGMIGETPVSWIQNAANQAAKTFTELK